MEICADVSEKILGFEKSVFDLLEGMSLEIIDAIIDLTLIRIHRDNRTTPL